METGKSEIEVVMFKLLKGLLSMSTDSTVSSCCQEKRQGHGLLI